MMVLMAFKSRKRQSPVTPCLWHCIASVRELSWKPEKCRLSLLRAGSKHHQIQSRLTRGPSLKRPTFYIHLGVYPSLLFSFRHLSAFGPGGWGRLLSAPSLMKWDLSSIADRWPSCYRERALAPSGYVALWRSSARPHVWPRGQPQMVTASVSSCGVPLTDNREQERSCPPALLCDRKRSLKQNTAVPSSLCPRMGQALGKEFGPSQTMLIVIILACGILVPWPGTEPRPLAMRAQSPKTGAPENSPIT